MGRAEFEENSLNWILDKSKAVAETISESAGVLLELFGETEREFSPVREEVLRIIHLVQSKLSSVRQARGECSKQIESCKRQYIRSDCTDEAEKQRQEQHNAAIDRKIAMLQQACGEMDRSISVLERNLETAHRLERELLSAKSEFDSVQAANAAKMQRTVSNGNRFYLAVELAHAKAMEIVNFKDLYFPAQGHSGMFKIDPTGHEGIIRRNRRASHALSDIGAVSMGLGVDDAPVAPSGITMVLEDTTAEQFLSRIDTLEEAACITVKAPSYNLHKLGGMKIITEMESRGFRVKRDGGSMIGSDGYITWEKQR